MCILRQLDKLTGVERELQFVCNLTNRYANSCFPAFQPEKLCAVSEPVITHPGNSELDGVGRGLGFLRPSSHGFSPRLGEVVSPGSMFALTPM